MKYKLIIAVLILSLRIEAQVISPADSLPVSQIRKAVSSVLADSGLWTPYPSTVDHRRLQGNLLQQICEGNDSLILHIVTLPAFSAFAVFQSHQYMEIKDLRLIEQELNELRNAYRNETSFRPDIVIKDTLLGDTSHVEIWNPNFKIKSRPKLTLLFLNHQLTNILIGKPERD